jgi:DNA (cytosine-5)-methyltransferase 1
VNRIADLFCGAGGTSTGILKACADLSQRADLLAVNHWTTAVNTHSLNHPGVRHICETLENINPRKAVGGRGHLHLLAASPECTHHSVAAGGRPKNEQSRATAWHICRWAADLTIENILIENVREFQSWGPLTTKGKPLKRRKGETFKAFINTLRGMGYNVEWRVICAADYGDPTSRRRLIIMARRGKEIIWPDASHGEDLKPWRTAREIIDWTIKGQSIFRRKRPLSINTIRRIAAGLRKFSGQNADPFLVMLYGTNDARSVDRPTPTVTANGNHVALAEPFIINLSHGSTDCIQSAGQPLQTITTAKGGELALCHPFITHLTHHGERKQHSVEDPMPTVTGAHRGELGLVEPMLIRTDQAKANGICVHSIDEPAPTIDTHARVGICEPFIVKYYGSGTAVPVNEPLDTVTSKDRFMLIEPKTGRAIAELDILFRMLQPHELAAAMSFPRDYQFTGNRGEQVKQIGNAVPVELARAHARALLS